MVIKQLNNARRCGWRDIVGRPAMCAMPHTIWVDDGYHPAGADRLVPACRGRCVSRKLNTPEVSCWVNLEQHHVQIWVGHGVGETKHALKVVQALSLELLHLGSIKLEDL